MSEGIKVSSTDIPYFRKCKSHVQGASEHRLGAESPIFHVSGPLARPSTPCSLPLRSLQVGL